MGKFTKLEDHCSLARSALILQWQTQPSLGTALFRSGVNDHSEPESYFLGTSTSHIKGNYSTEINTYITHFPCQSDVVINDTDLCEDKDDAN